MLTQATHQLIQLMQDINGWGDNDRGVGFTFGPNVVRSFLQKEKLDLICRAHQVGMYLFMHMISDAGFAEMECSLVDNSLNDGAPGRGRWIRVLCWTTLGHDLLRGQLLRFALIATANGNHITSYFIVCVFRRV